MKTRILSAAALLPLLLIVVLLLPSVCTAVFVGLMASVAAYELLWRTGLVKNLRLVIYSIVSAMALCLINGFGNSYVCVLAELLVLFVALFSEMLLSKGKLAFRKIGYCLFAGLLIPFLLSAITRIRCMENGKVYILIPFILAFLSDSGAYFIGKFFGRHKLAPVISPKKTVEGVFGGVAAAIIGVLIFCAVLSACHYRVNWLFAPVYGILGSVGAVFGDLCFSVIKRETGIKDYGNLIPGHGGILDRMDSMMVVAPLSELLILIACIAER